MGIEKYKTVFFLYCWEVDHCAIGLHYWNETIKVDFTFSYTLYFSTQDTAGFGTQLRNGYLERILVNMNPLVSINRWVNNLKLWQETPAHFWPCTAKCISASLWNLLEIILTLAPITSKKMGSRDPLKSLKVSGGPYCLKEGQNGREMNLSLQQVVEGFSPVWVLTPAPSLSPAIPDTNSGFSVHSAHM